MSGGLGGGVVGRLFIYTEGRDGYKGNYLCLTGLDSVDQNKQKLSNTIKTPSPMIHKQNNKR